MRYFKLDEFKCKCGCNENKISLELVSLLDNARELANMPFIVNSGYRCKKHNMAIGGVKNSFHTQGLASDIRFKNDSELYKMLYALLKAGFERILIYPRRKFIHVDIGKKGVQAKIIKIMEVRS